MKKREYHVHIINMGTNPDPSLAMTRNRIPIDKVYLLCAKDISGSVGPEIYEKLKNAERQTVEVLKENGIREIEVRRVESWEFQSIIDEILGIASKENARDMDVKFHINFTSGTHVMAGAACAAAFYIGADLYYVMNREEHKDLTATEEMRVFGIPSLPDVSSIKKLTKKVLMKIYESGPIQNSELMMFTKLSPSKLGYHTKVLKEMDLIEREREGTSVIWKCTYAGNIAYKIIEQSKYTDKDDMTKDAELSIDAPCKKIVRNGKIVPYDDGPNDFPGCYIDEEGHVIYPDEMDLDRPPTPEECKELKRPGWKLIRNGKVVPYDGKKSDYPGYFDEDGNFIQTEDDSGYEWYRSLSKGFSLPSQEELVRLCEGSWHHQVVVLGEVQHVVRYGERRAGCEMHYGLALAFQVCLVSEERSVHDVEMMREAYHLDILDVPNVAADVVPVAVVDAEDLAAFPADPYLVPPLEADQADPVPGDPSPFPDADVPAEPVHGPLVPVHVAQVTDHPPLAPELVLVVRVPVAGAFGLDARDERIHYLHVPIDLIGIDLGHAEAHVGEEIGQRVPDGSEPLPGMDLLDDPSRMLPEEPPGIEAPVADYVEMRSQLPHLLLPPGMEDGDARRGPDVLEGVAHEPHQLVVVLRGLHHALGELLWRGHDPMPEIASSDALLVAELLESEQVALGFHSVLEGGVVHAMGAAEGPAMPALALAVMFRMIGAHRVDYAALPAPDEAAAASIRSFLIMAGHPPVEECMVPVAERDRIP